MPKIHNVFILKDGIPIFHVNPVANLIETNAREEKSETNMDSALVAGFLSAIASFATEIGIGVPKRYITELMEFSFLSYNDILFILGTTGVDENEVEEILQEIAEKFVEMVIRDNLKITVANLSPFKKILREILAGYIHKYNLLQESFLIKQFAELIPQSHIGSEALKRLTETRRMLFKMIDGNNSIYEIAKATKQDPRMLLSVLRSYTKSGQISFQRQTTSDPKRLKFK
ncbi:MAG: hypothetical protein ACTSRS_02630 [Candidatus Helarchaeota archaeon]